MQAVSNTGRSGVLVLKVDEDDVNTVQEGKMFDGRLLCGMDFCILKVLPTGFTTESGRFCCRE